MTLDTSARLAEVTAELREANDGKATTSVPGAAQLLGCSDANVRRLIWAGELPAHRVGGGRRSPLRIRVADLAKWLIEAEARAIPLAPRPVRDRAARMSEGHE